MIYNSKKLINSMLSPFLGDFDTLQWHKRNIKMNPLVSEAIDRIEKRWNIDKSEAKETPIFLLSAGWRSGSTLLQRLINSSDNILIWGEPYSYSDYVRKLADSLKIFSQITLPDNFIIDSFIDKNNNKITDGWTACLYPNPKNL